MSMASDAFPIGGILLLFICVGAIVGFTVGGAACLLTEPESELIAECEKTLPRNQHCELVAVPITNGEQT